MSFETENFLLSHPEVTGVMVGEGEETFCEQMAFYAHPEGKNLEDIRAWSFDGRSLRRKRLPETGWPKKR